MVSEELFNFPKNKGTPPSHRRHVYTAIKNLWTSIYSWERPCCHKTVADIGTIWLLLWPAVDLWVISGQIRTRRPIFNSNNGRNIVFWLTDTTLIWCTVFVQCNRGTQLRNTSYTRWVSTLRNSCSSVERKRANLLNDKLCLSFASTNFEAAFSIKCFKFVAVRITSIVLTGGVRFIWKQFFIITALKEATC